MGDLVFRLIDGISQRLKTGGVQGKKIGLSGAMQRDFARGVECRTRHVDIAVVARSTVVLGGVKVLFFVTWASKSSTG